MQLVYVDGFDHYTSASGGAGNRIYELDPAWSVPPQAIANHGGLLAMPVLGGKGLYAYWDAGTNSSGNLNFFKDLGLGVSSGDIVAAGFHFCMTNQPGADGLGAICAFAAGATVADFLCLKVGPTGALQVRTRVGGTLHGTSIGVLSTDTVYHIEFQIYLHASLGEVHVRVDGVPFLDITDINTLAITPVGIGFIADAVGGSSTAQGCYIDNLYVWKDTGAYSNTWMGELMVATLLPMSDESPQDWSLASGSDAYAMIDNVPANPAQYIEADTATETSRFGVQNLADPNATVVGVAVNVRAHKTGSGTTTIDYGVVSGGVEELGGTGDLTQNVNSYHQHIVEKDPNTNAPWTPSGVNALLLHVERTA